MTRVCMYCKKPFGEKCPICGAGVDREQLVTFRCRNTICGVVFIEGFGGETHGICPECRARRVHACTAEIANAIADQRPGNWSALLGEMDQRRELHRLNSEDAE